MGLARPAVAERNHVLAPLDVRAAREFQNQHLVQARDRRKVEAVQAFDCREPRLTDAPLHHSPVTIKQLEFGQAPAWCTDHGCGRTDPNPGPDYAMRT